MNLNKWIFSAWLLIFTTIAVAEQPSSNDPNIESYGMLPKYRSIAISPNGKHYALLQRDKESEFAVVLDAQTKELVAGANTSEMKARDVYFLDDNYVIIVGSKTTRAFGIREKWEHSAAFSLNLKTKKIRQLLKGSNIYPAQSGLGQIVGFNPRNNKVYMPAFSDESPYPKNLYAVSIKTGRAKIHAKGSASTRDWFVTDDGTVLAKEEYKEKQQEHRIYSKTSGAWKLIYSKKTAIPQISVQAISADSKQLLFVDDLDDSQAVYSMSLEDGTVDGPLFSRSDADIDYLMQDINRKLEAVVYSGMYPAYQFMDTKAASVQKRIEATYPDSSVYYQSATADKSKVIFKVSGADGAGNYMLLNEEAQKLYWLASEYPAIKEIREIVTIEYKARDGLKIPAILTFPANRAEREKLPLIVLPHGGPASYDSVRFDWLAQYLAYKGYLVMQPNFRGSTGFGYEFQTAGYGKWGKEMQNDVTDGVKALIKAGYVDPERVAIMGASYGGYSALAGGAFTPDLYRCIISIAGVSDLPVMLRDDKRNYGSKHWVVSYWNRVVGDSKTERDKLEGVSPVNFADKFQVPVLLIHGKDDTVVPIRQSNLMAKALKKAGKPVELITLKGGDHWLSTSSSRLATLKAIDAFLAEHNPAD